MKIFGNRSPALLGNRDIQTASAWNTSSRVSFQTNNSDGSLLFFTEDMPESYEQMLSIFDLQGSDWRQKTLKLFLSSCLQIPIQTDNVGGELNFTQRNGSKNTVIGDWYYPPPSISALVRTNNATSATGNLEGLRIARHKISICNNQGGTTSTGGGMPASSTFDQGKDIPSRSSTYTARGSLLDTNFGTCGLLGNTNYYTSNSYTFYNTLIFNKPKKFNAVYIRRDSFQINLSIRYWDQVTSTWLDVNTNGLWTQSTYFNAPVGNLSVLFRFPERVSDKILITSALGGGQADRLCRAQCLVAGHTDDVYANIPNDTIKWCLYIPNLDSDMAANGLSAGNLTNNIYDDYPMVILPVGDANSDAPIRLDSLDIGHTDQPQTKQLVYGRVSYNLR